MTGARVFVSYRRADNPFFAGRLRDRLSASYGEERVFFDVDSVPIGADFREVVRSTLNQVDVVVALVGPAWDATKLAEPNDFVRMELEEAFTQGKIVIPVLVGDTSMPRPQELPRSLERFAFINAHRVRSDPDFRDDARRLVEGIDRAIDRRDIEAKTAAAAAAAAQRAADDLRQRTAKPADPHHDETPVRAEREGVPSQPAAQSLSSDASPLSRRPQSPLARGLMILLALVALVVGFVVVRAVADDGDSSSTSAPRTSTESVSPATPGATTVTAMDTSATIVVANMAGVGGAAGQMTTALQSLGYATAENANGLEDFDTSIVYFEAGSEGTAASVARSLGGVATAPMPATLPIEGGAAAIGDATVVVMLGRDLAGTPLSDIAG